MFDPNRTELFTGRLDEIVDISQRHTDDPGLEQAA